MAPTDCSCPCCEGELKVWPGKEDVSQVVDVIETRYGLKTQSLSKYRCRCGHIETAIGRGGAQIGRRAVEIREGLQVYLTRPQVPITSNPVEAALRSPVVGRKVLLGSRSKAGIAATGVLHTLIESAKLRGVDPATYLKRAITAALAHEVIPLPHELV